MAMDSTDDGSALSRADALTREEVLRRRCRRVRQLARLYREQYWELMEEVRAKYRDYYWTYGKSPYEEDQEEEEEEYGEAFRNCVVGGCKSKAMALTRFCHPHILSDSKQKLYKGCGYTIKSAPSGPILCGKPILRSTVPSLCSVHFQKAEKDVTRALKNAGLNVPSSSRRAPKFHVMVTEFVREIQSRRKAAKETALTAPLELRNKEDNNHEDP